MYRKLLVPYDNSEPAQRALTAALDMAAGVPDAHITVLSVVDWHDYNAETFKIASRMAGIAADDVDLSVVSSVGEEARQAEIDRIAKAIAPLGGDASNISVEVANGSPHDMIVDFSDDGDFDCIVMGHRGLGKIRGMLGSVCYAVLQKATRPVLVIK